MKLVFTVDMEDWYQGVGLPVEAWGSFEKRIKIGHYKLLQLLSKKKIKATYFVLGKVVEEFPELIKEIKAEGHEIGCHTYSHPFLYKISPEEFRTEIRRCKELIFPIQDGFDGFRAPYFSVDWRNMWVMKILREEGFVYDSSLFPGSTGRTSLKGTSKEIYAFENGLVEYPLNTFKMASLDFGVGGGYFRLLPYRYFKKRLSAIATKDPVLFYIHPWELDADQPQIPGLSKRIRLTHYVNLASTEKKLDNLLSDFDFCTLKQTIKINYGTKPS